MLGEKQSLTTWKPDTSFFHGTLLETDRDISIAVLKERARLDQHIELIASENIVSASVLEAQGSVLTNKYAEGYPGRRYYGGCEHVDVAETKAIERVKELFGCEFANVQPHSGAQANGAVMLAILKPGDTILGLSLAAGGHLTHGAAPAQSGKWFNAVHYGVRREDGLIDYDEVRALALECRPKLIIAGWSAYPRTLDFSKFRDIADEVGAMLMVDMAHFAGLVAAGLHPSPIGFADIVTSTTHKTLRGPRGGIILTNDEKLAKRINSAVFPGLQGGPLMHVIAAKAVAFSEALKPSFKDYIRSVLTNAGVLSDVLLERGIDIVTGGTDTHVVLVDLRSKGLTGKQAEASLCRAHLTCNKNAVPFDPQKPMVTSGIRLGSSAATTRGFGPDEFRQIGKWIADIIDNLQSDESSVEALEKKVAREVVELCKTYPVY